ncbi:hypothetical protein BKA65DRAFT_578439 [Rhexocercosporidium sp. MPI-PUGE-AT-0058]|nr:hypothetical protein BKA65DRAFT_578439 [Rhexocercosporidium sp. MPI-PUGE-AT-0058]
MGEILLSQNFNDIIRSSVNGDSNEEDKQTAIPDHGLVLERLRGPMLHEHLSQINTTLVSSYLIKLHESLRTTLKSLHRFGIVHSDIKNNNIIFRTDCASPANCCVIDFGHADFQSQLSARSWQEECDSDEASLHDIFHEVEAQLAIKLGLQFLKSSQIDLSSKSFSPGTEDAMNLLKRYDHPWKEGNYIESLVSHPNLSNSSCPSRYPPEICNLRSLRLNPLTNTILSLIPSPEPLLALSLIDILLKACRYSQATSLLHAQLSNPSLALPFLARFREQKIGILIEGGYILQARVAAIEAAMPIFLQAYGESSLDLLYARYRLANAWRIMGNKERSREIYWEFEGGKGHDSSSDTDSENASEKERNDVAKGELLKKWRREVGLY